jgi:hypothetical protein
MQLKANKENQNESEIKKQKSGKVGTETERPHGQVQPERRHNRQFFAWLWCREDTDR